MDKLNKKQIVDLLPHREPMLLIDELYDMKKLSSATAVVNVKKDSFFVQGHFPDIQVMPGVLILESLAQASGLLVFKTPSLCPPNESLYLFVGIDKARFKKLIDCVVDIKKIIRYELLFLNLIKFLQISIEVNINM